MTMQCRHLKLLVDEHQLCPWLEREREKISFTLILILLLFISFPFFQTVFIAILNKYLFDVQFLQLYRREREGEATHQTSY